MYLLYLLAIQPRGELRGCSLSWCRSHSAYAKLCFFIVFLLSDFFFVVFLGDNTVTGIETLPGMDSEMDQSDSNVYDLQGRRINSNIHKGIYIKNGTKLIK